MTSLVRGELLGTDIVIGEFPRLKEPSAGPYHDWAGKVCSRSYSCAEFQAGPASIRHAAPQIYSLDQNEAALVRHRDWDDPFANRHAARQICFPDQTESGLVRRRDPADPFANRRVVLQICFRRRDEPVPSRSTLACPRVVCPQVVFQQVVSQSEAVQMRAVLSEASQQG
jgi:hypothetical protein